MSALLARCVAVRAALVAHPSLDALDALAAVEALLAGAEDAPDAAALLWHADRCFNGDAGWAIEAAGWLALGAAHIDEPREVRYALGEVDECLRLLAAGVPASRPCVPPPPSGDESEVRLATVGEEPADSTRVTLVPPAGEMSCWGPDTEPCGAPDADWAEVVLPSLPPVDSLVVAAE